MMKRYASLLLLSIACIATAIFLRLARGNVIREALTSLLGFDWRAVIEHFFASVGIPLAAAIGFVVMWLALEWGRYGVSSRFGWKSRWLSRWLSRHPHDVVPDNAVAIVVAALGLAYIAASLLFELYQAECSVYGKAARGYFQGWQFFADVAGACLSFSFACVYGRLHQNVAQPCGQPDLTHKAAQGRLP